MNSPPPPSHLSTLKHIARVRELLGDFAIEMIRRGNVHDASKFSEVETGPLDAWQRITDAEGHAPFGSEAYKRQVAVLQPMLQHHYKHNSHHPEHYDNGIDGMDLFDLVEMFFDWKAASERGNETVFELARACQIHNVGPQLQSIFVNTAKRLRYRAG
jgi:hypothetical protein